MTPEEIAIGPDTTAGPAQGRWTVTASKSDGVTPGFTIKGANGQLWFLKFDPPGYRAMSTGTEVAVTKLVWALGYHVPENHIGYMRTRPDDPNDIVPHEHRRELAGRTPKARAAPPA